MTELPKYYIKIQVKLQYFCKPVFTKICTKILDEIIHITKQNAMYPAAHLTHAAVFKTCRFFTGFIKTKQAQMQLHETCHCFDKKKTGVF